MATVFPVFPSTQEANKRQRRLLAWDTRLATLIPRKYSLKVPNNPDGDGSIYVHRRVGWARHRDGLKSLLSRITPESGSPGLKLHRPKSATSRGWWRERNCAPAPPNRRGSRPSLPNTHHHTSVVLDDCLATRRKHTNADTQIRYRDKKQQ